MKIVVATPLYPPDPATTAGYVKDLATRLATSHEVTVVAYAHIPEAIAGVKIVSIDKRLPALLRLPLFLASLFRRSAGSAVVLAVNGPSVDTPLLFFSLVSTTPVIRLMHDQTSKREDGRSLFRRRMSASLQKQAYCVIETFPPSRPEIHPVEPPPTANLSDYEKSWHKHLEDIKRAYAAN